jgi:uncharacterized 2Fe-2S/4Fe-4S cluster protein (DUF4445 family)
LFTIKNVSSGHVIDVEPGAFLIQALADAGLMLEDSSCGRQGLCEKCLVRTRPGEDEDWKEVLACQTPVLSDLQVDMPGPGRLRKYVALREGSGARAAFAPSVRKIFVESCRLALAWEELSSRAGIPPAARTPEDMQVVRELSLLLAAGKSFTAVIASHKIVGVEEGDTCARLCGMAFDIGTTTVVGYLLNLLDGELLATVSALNPQVSYGADVISRISLTEREPPGLEQLREAIVACVDGLIGEAVEQAGLRREDVYDLVFVGNPCMHHLFFGIRPVSLGKAPYQPVVREQVEVAASQAGARASRFARLTWLPAVAGFVGADTVGMLLAHPLGEAGDATLALDIGTNGEIVLSCRGELWAASAAAGPAFEGTAMTSGMRAQSGAIDRAWIGKDGWGYNVIDQVRPRGMCGSGLVDAVAALLNEGLIKSSGRIVPPAGDHPLARSFVTRGGSAAFVLVPGDAAEGGREIVITQHDVRQLQLAKAAISTGILLLSQEAQQPLEELQRVILAGAFGMYLSLAGIRAIGLLPGTLCDRIVAVGNAAGAGAQNALLSQDSRRLATEIAARVRYVELAGRADFTDMFLQRLEFSWS